MNNLYENYLQIDSINELLQNFYNSTKNKNNHCLTNFYQYLEHNNKNKKIISVCKHIIQNPKIYRYFNRFNSAWIEKQMNVIQWIKHSSHPGPIITISMKNNKYYRINNFDTITQFSNKQCIKALNLKYRHPDELFIAKSTTGFIKFQSHFDEYILSPSKKEEIRFLSQTEDKINTNLNTIINNLSIDSTSNKTKKFYCLKYYKILHKKFDLNILIQVSPITSRSLWKGSQIKGSKFKFQIIQSQSCWDKMNIKQQFLHYNMSHYLTNFIIKSGNCIWNQHYYYQYALKFAKDTSKEHIYYAYIDYLASKPIDSITKYYSNSSKINKQSHNELFLYFCNKTGKKYNDNNYNPLTSHLFWIGATVHQRIVSYQWKNELFSRVDSWKNNGSPPKGIYCDPGKKRIKYFINYRYTYRSNKNLSTAEIEKANLKAGGLRNINNCRFPVWIKEFIKYLKWISFIDPQTEINQIGINYYFNDNESKSIYNSIDPHLEDEKFSVVYSISIYKNPKSPTYLSFGLNLNCSCGDTKIRMNDCDGIKFESFD